MNLIIQSIQNRLLLQHQNKFQHGFIPLIMSNLKNICFNIFLLSFVFPIKIGTGDTSFGYAQEKQKIKAGTITASRLYRDRLFLPNSFTQFLYYCTSALNLYS